MDADEIKNLWPGYQVFKVFLLYSSSRQGVSRDPEVLGVNKSLYSEDTL